MVLKTDSSTNTTYEKIEYKIQIQPFPNCMCLYERPIYRFRIIFYLFIYFMLFFFFLENSQSFLMFKLKQPIKTQRDNKSVQTN